MACCQSSSVTVTNPPLGADEPPTLWTITSTPLKRSRIFVDDLRRALRCGHVCLDVVGCGFFGGDGPGRNGDGRAALQEPFGDGLAGALGSASHQDAFAGEFALIDRGHESLLFFFSLK